MSRLPRIPDTAFDAALRKVGTWLDVGAGEIAVRGEAEAQERAFVATDSLFRSLGLEGENDQRAWALSRVVLAHLRGVASDSVDHGDVDIAVMGITLGLMLAETTGWEPPLERDEP